MVDEVRQRIRFMPIDEPAINGGNDLGEMFLTPSEAEAARAWRRTGGGTIERWNDDDGPPAAYGIRDSKGRLTVVMVHDSDIPDGWEREAEDPEYFFSFSPDAYAVGIDVLLYAMTY